MYRKAIVTAILAMAVITPAHAIQNCWFETPKYGYTSLKPSATADPVQYLTQYGYVCYGNAGSIQPATLMATGGNHSSMTAWLNQQLNVPTGYNIQNAGSYVTALSGWSQCSNHTADGSPILYWNTWIDDWDYYTTTEYYTELGGSFCSVDTTIQSYDGATAPRKLGVSSEAADSNVDHERQPTSVPELSTGDLYQLADLHQVYLYNRATREQWDIFMERMQSAVAGQPDEHARAVAMESSLRAAVSELEGRAIPLGNHIRRAAPLVQSTP